MQIYILFLLLGFAWGGRRRNLLQNPDLFQGDIAGIEDINDRNAVILKSRLWRGGVVTYKIDPSLDNIKGEILRAMRHISDQTCLTFRERSFEKDYIRIFSGEGCYSYWGRFGGVQPLSLEAGCEPFGTIIHELCHAIGFAHEQSRSDRDDYLIIYWENIMKGAEDQFRKLMPHRERKINGFDYNSIMIYGEEAFSYDDIQKTMVAKKKGVRLTDPFEKKGLNPSDVYRINTLYDCNK